MIAALVPALLLTRAKILPIISGLLAISFAILIAMSTPAFQQSSDAFALRWELASSAEAQNTDSSFSSGVGVFEQRVLGSIFGPLTQLESTPLLGRGIGIGTNIGAQRLTQSFSFLVGEGSWQVTLAELGLPIGIIFLLWRVVLTLWIMGKVLRSVGEGNKLPLILLGSSFLNILVGQLSQPTGLGFLVLSAGLTLAACNTVSVIFPSPRLSHPFIHQLKPLPFS